MRLKDPRARYLVLLPILGVALDFFENSGASLVMFMYPEKIPSLLYIVPLFTMAKWLSIGASFLVLILLIINHGIGFFKSG